MSVEKILKGDILNSQSQTLVNTVNTVGVMGKGIALEFRNRFPDMYDDYVKRCAAGEVRLGRPYLFKRLIPPWVLNFPTKDHWRGVSRLESIVEGLEYLESHISPWGIESLAVPPLGCGHGQLEWDVVGPTLYRHLNKLDIPVEMYAPYEVSDAELDREWLADSLTAKSESEGSRLPGPIVVLAEIVARLYDAPLVWPVGRTRFQKLAYFATVAGVPTDLDFSEGSYGPFASDLKKALSRLINNGVLTEEQGRGNLIRLGTGRTFKDAIARYHGVLKQYEEAIKRVADLLARLDSRQLELAATVHFVAESLRARQGSTPTDITILHEVERWKRRRKPPFSTRETAEVIVNLINLGWLEAEVSGDLPVDQDVIAYA